MVLALSILSAMAWYNVARADRTIHPPLDIQLLEADCAVRARVTGIKPIASIRGREMSRVSIDVIEQMWCRWAWADDGAAFSAIGQRSEEEGSIVIPHRGALVEGEEYVLFLNGGSVLWSSLTANGLTHIGADGRAECGGGHIYGLTPAGLRCSWDGVEVGAPLSGAELAAAVSAARANAALRRPSEAARVEARAFDAPGVPR